MESDPVWLVTALIKATAGVNPKYNASKTFHNKLADMHRLRQGQTELLADYLSRFEQLVKTMQLAGGSGCLVPLLSTNWMQ